MSRNPSDWSFWVPRRDTRLEWEGAEFLVLGQLLIRGIPAYKAYSNLANYDLLATSLNGQKSARIQIKSRWAADAPHFLISKIECEFVVLVKLNRDGRSSKLATAAPHNQEPEYFVMTDSEARQLLDDQDTGWGKIRLRRPELVKYRNRWEVVADALGISTPQEPVEAL